MVYITINKYSPKLIKKLDDSLKHKKTFVLFYMDGCGPCEYMHGSFFDLNSNDVGGQFDFAYDYTFLCALDPSMRTEWAATYARLLKTEGKLFTAVFPIGERSGGPPYAMTVDLIESLLSPHGFKKTFEKQLGENEAHESRYNGPMNTTFCVWSRS